MRDIDFIHQEGGHSNPAEVEKWMKYSQEELNRMVEEMIARDLANPNKELPRFPKKLRHHN